MQIYNAAFPQAPIWFFAGHLRLSKEAIFRHARPYLSCTYIIVTSHIKEIQSQEKEHETSSR